MGSSTPLAMQAPRPAPTIKTAPHPLAHSFAWVGLLCLLLLAGCGANASSGVHPPLVFPTLEANETGPAPLSLYYSAPAANAQTALSISAVDAATALPRWTYTAKAALTIELELDQENVYTGSVDHHVYALNKRDGSQRWSADLQEGVPQPILAQGGLVYGVIAPGGNAELVGPVFALNASDGSLKWRSQVSGRFMEMVDGVIYLNGESDQTLYALSASDGSQRWQFKAAYSIHQIEVAGGRVYVATSAANSLDARSTLYALSVRSGALQWRYPRQNDKGGLFLAGADTNSAYLVSTGETNFNFSRILALNAQTGAERWRYQASDGNQILAPLLSDGTLYATQPGGTLFALNAANGALRWPPKKLADTDAFISLIDGGILYLTSGSRFSSGDNTIHAIRGADGAALWNYPFNAFLDPLAVRNGVLYAFTFASSGAHNHLLAVDVSSGVSIWDYDTGTGFIIPVLG